MFLPEQETTITLYSRYMTPGNVHTNIRCVLRGCVWNDDSVSIFNRTGQTAQNNITIQIPYRHEVTGMKWIDPSEWLKLDVATVESGEFWTASPRLLNFNTFPQVVRGISDFEFDWNDSGRVTTQESQFANINPNVRRVREINLCLDAYADTRQNVEYTSDMRFILLRAAL